MKQLFIWLMAITATNATSQNNAVSWNKVLTGVIGTYPATLYLQKTDDLYTGYYYYNSKQIPIYLGSYEETTGDTIRVSAYENNRGETLDGIYTAGVYSGEWINVAGEKRTTLRFSFTGSKPLLPYFELVYTTYTTEYPVGLEKGQNPYFNYYASALWPATGTPEPLAGFLKKWVNQQFGNKNMALPIGRFFINEKNKESAAWKKDLSAIKTSELKEYPGANSLSSERRHLIMYQSDRFLTIADPSYVYTGGAHINGGTSMHVLDLKMYKELKLNDVFTPAGKQKLLALLDAAVRAKFNIPKGVALNDADAGLLVKNITVTENFYLTGTGIGFSYMPYEIAAYAYGEVNLFLTFDKLQGLLQAGFGK